jgi:conjugal transfer mating pair stabilization protein TraG
VVSTLGYQITRLFEQAFSTPQMTEEGFGSSLALLVNSREAVFGSANPLGGGDLTRTLVEYIKDCTTTGIDLSPAREPAILNAPHLLEALRFESSVYGTLTFLPGDPPRGAERDCTEAHDKIRSHIDSGEFRTAWDHYLTSRYGQDPLTRVGNALDAIAGVGYDARTVMLNNVLSTIYLQGIRQKSVFTGNVAQALIVESALAQRNTQWAAERDVWMRSVRPMLAAFEGCSTP